MPLRAALLVCTALTAQALPASAQNWTGATSTDWFDPTNWDSNVPVAGANVVIDNTNPGGQGAVIDTQPTGNLTDITIGSSGTGKLTITNGGGLTAGAGFLGYNLGSTGSVLLDCGCTTWHTDGGTFVGYGGSGTFTVTGGAVTNLGTSVGTFAGANGAVIVDGGTSSWTTSASSGPPIDGQIIVGDAGAGTFTVRNGGTVNTVDTYLGLTGSAVGTATVTGSGSSWTGSGNMYVGSGATGTFNVSDGATVTIDGTYPGFGTQGLTVVGYGEGANGTVNVSTGGSWSSATGIIVGGNTVPNLAGGTGTFNVFSGGTVTTGQTDLGVSPGSSGTINVSDAGSVWTTNGTTTVGYLTTGTFNVSNGGTVNANGDTFLGLSAGATGTATVTGLGSNWTNGGDLYVGGSGFAPTGGNGTFSAADNATVVVNGNTFLGYNAGSTGTVTVSNGATWQSNSDVLVGYSGTGNFNVTNGGEVHVTSDAYLGYIPGSVGTVNVSGVSGATHSTWTSDGYLIVGEQGTGVLNVQSGGVVNANGPLIIGDCSCAIGTVTVTGAGSQFNSTATGPTDVSIGYGGAGTFNVTDGAAATFATDVYLGVYTGSTGTVTVSGAGSTWTSAGAVIVGSDGTGTFTVANGGTVSSGVLFVGADPGSTGTVTVTGAGSSWTTNSTPTVIGFFGTGTLNVLNGATANLGDISVSVFGAPGTLHVDATSQVTGTSYSQSSTGTYRVGLNQATNGRVTLTGGDIDLTGGGALVVDAKTTQARTYTIMSTNGAVFGTFDPTKITVNGNANNLQVQYNADSITLSVDTFSVASLLPAGVTGNAKNVATGIDHAILAGANVPDPFFDVFNLTGANLVNALNQLSGEAATGGVQAGTQMMNSFLSLLLNPFGGAPGGNPGTLGFARDFGAGDKAQAPEAALAYAAVTPKDKRVDPFGQRWGIWGAAYGGYNKNSGDAATGSHDTTARAYGLATGYDYRVSGDSTVGFALAGGGASWGLSSNLGTGRSDVLQLGAYATQKFGAAYVSAALSYAWHSVSTDRTVTVSGADHLTASFNAQSIGGRLETGYRYLTPFAGITPYASLQVQDFITPSYGETAISGSSAFALAYGARSTVATRTELGAWFDKTMAVTNGDVLTLRTRAAWANDHSGNQGVSAAFQTLPGSNFTVNGAAPATNLALLSAGAELRMAQNVSLGVKLDGEFAARSQTYAATGTVRYGW